MQELESIAINLLSTGIGLLIPNLYNSIAGKEVVQNEQSNQFYGWLCLVAIPLIICQYISNQYIRAILTLIAGMPFSMRILCYKRVEYGKRTTPKEKPIRKQRNVTINNTSLK